ncbi:MAG: uracil-DNA glycosylase [Alphaproteobacteria bacterium]|nr:uracil-DNA glycosylase [Alphaproteobacteria bacterium]
MDHHDKEMSISDSLHALMWQIEMGADEALSDDPIDRYALLREKQAAKKAAAEAVMQQSRNVQSNPPSRSPSKSSSMDSSVPLGTAEAVAKANKALENIDSFDALKQAIIDFDGLASLKQAASHTVVGDGSLTPKVMIIGEAPGRDDDRSGIAFSGPEGQFLDKMFKGIKLSRDDFFATNLIFWRPPGNSTPSEAQIQVCKPFLFKMIKLLAPSAVICLGAKPLEVLAGQTGGISRLRGKWFDHGPTDSTSNELEKVPVRAIFSPATLIKTPAKKRPAMQDVSLHGRTF